ncbi:L-lactate permease [Kineosporia sp. J2-2]|uniref:L-lactate permease n=1 Tax=Kineosporia corallincola TaxID=2835133 RepID=A0ABS5TD69_9ACTN|nr:L-lactate permease [Kineosporia corallincola]MBT0769000.1 L-lactate permease [Kineosporia corallincola]
MHQQDLDPLAGSLAWSALFAALPLVVLFVLLGVFRVRAWLAAVTGLALALLVALLVWTMPVDQALLAATEGAAFGLFPVMWIVVNAIWVYQLTRRSGHFDVLQRTFSNVSPDRRVQGVIIAFCFGALLEALAGFGAPVAICSVMLVAIGLSPIKAATTALVANTAPVAYGAVATPVITLAQVSGLPLRDVSAMTGRQVPFLALIVPFLLLYLLDGWRGLRQVWPLAAVVGASFALAQFAVSNYGPVELSDIAAALLAAGAALLLLRAWHPDTSEDPRAGDETPTARHDAEKAMAGPAPTENSGSAGEPGTTPSSSHIEETRPDHPQVVDDRREILRAFAPYLIVIALFSVVAVPAVKERLSGTTTTFGWPGLDVVKADGSELALTTFKFDWLATGGTVLLLTGVLTGLVLRLGVRDWLGCYGEVLVQLRTAVLTVVAVLGIAYVMNTSGMTSTLAAWLAGAGSLFALLSPLLGWFGTAVTGSDTSSNSLFGALQVSAAAETGLDPLLLAASNGSGGVLGKMVSPQNLAIGAAAVGLAGREGELFRAVLRATVILLPVMCLLVVLQASPVLSWMVP